VIPIGPRELVLRENVEVGLTLSVQDRRLRAVRRDQSFPWRVNLTLVQQTGGTCGQMTEIGKENSNRVVHGKAEIETVSTAIDIERIAIADRVLLN
jgi:hypothetical protein